MENFARDADGLWRFLPSQVMSEPAWLLDDLTQIRNVARKFERQLEKKRKADRGSDG